MLVDGLDFLIQGVGDGLAGVLAAIVNLEDVANFGQAETEGLRSLDKGQPMNGVVVEEPKPTFGPGDGVNEAEFFVVADGFDGNATAVFELANA